MQEADIGISSAKSPSLESTDGSYGLGVACPPLSSDDVYPQEIFYL